MLQERKGWLDLGMVFLWSEMWQSLIISSWNSWKFSSFLILQYFEVSPVLSSGFQWVVDDIQRLFQCELFWFWDCYSALSFCRHRGSCPRKSGTGSTVCPADHLILRKGTYLLLRLPGLFKKLIMLYVSPLYLAFHVSGICKVRYQNPKENLAFQGCIKVKLSAKLWPHVCKNLPGMNPDPALGSGCQTMTFTHPQGTNTVEVVQQGLLAQCLDETSIRHQPLAVLSFLTVCHPVCHGPSLLSPSSALRSLLLQ